MNRKLFGGVASGLVAVLVLIVVIAVLRGGDEVVMDEAPPERVVAARPESRAEVSAPAAVSAALQAAPAPEPSLSEQEVYEEEPLAETTPAPEPTPEPAPAPKVMPLISVRVIEEGTGLPVPNVRVALTTELEDTGEELPIPGRIGRFDQDSDEKGIAVFADAPPDTYRVTARLGFGPRAEAEEPVVSKMNGKHEIEIVFPAKIQFLCRLMDEAENPVANREIQVGTALPGGGGGNFALAGFNWGVDWETVTTDAEGYFHLLSYEETRSAGIATKGPELFSSKGGRNFFGGGRRGRGDADGPWANPHMHMGRLDAEGETVFVIREEVVVATGVLVNAPDPVGESGYFARVRGGSAFYPALPVEDDTFTFSITPGTRATIEIGQNVESTARRDRNSREKTVEIEFPEEAGPFEFEIEFEERAFVEGVVYLPDGEGAKDVTVTALGAREATEGDAPAPDRGGGRWGNWNGRGDNGSTRIVSPPTDERGRFRMELPPAESYTFSTETETLPEDAKGSDPLTKSWTEIEAGGEVELWLKTSSYLWGEVFDARGYPVPEAQVNLRGPDIPWNSPDFQTYTDADGVFELNIPPIRLAVPDPEEPPEHYVFAFHRTYGGGLGQVFLDDPENRVQVRLADFASLQLTVTENGVPVPEIRFAQLYTVPGFSQPVSSRNSGRMREEDGVYNFRFLLKGLSSVNVWTEGERQVSVRTVLIEDDGPDRVEAAIDLAQPPARSGN